MGLRLYDTLRKEKVAFEPIDPANVRMYVCGPTVYDFAHIGNARPVIVFDVLFRLLRHLYGEAHVTYVRNITDVDDKINARAAAEGVSIRAVTERTAAQFHEDVAALGCLKPTHEPRATAHIPQMVAMIERLIARGVAYVAADHVLFSPNAMAARQPRPRYGALARRSLDEMLAGARVDVAPYKRDAMDFVLWKPSKPGEPAWPSPAGIAAPGRPGWHIECSAMSMATLLEPFGGGLDCADPAKNIFDIHGGGIDLVFPHHENEIAQSCCAFGTERMATIWMHNGFLQVEGQKMSKSLGNFVTIRELLRGWHDQAWAGSVVRWAMLQTHYRQPIDWTFESLVKARSEVFAFLSRIHRDKSFADYSGVNSNYSIKLFNDFIDQITPSEELIDTLSDDINLPKAIYSIRKRWASRNANGLKQVFADLRFLGVIRDLDIWNISHMYTTRNAPHYKQRILLDIVESIRVALSNNDKILLESLKEKVIEMNGSINIASPFEINIDFPTMNDGGIERLISARLAARRARNFAEADRIRDELAALGIQLTDGKDPVTGEPVTTWELKR